MVNHAYGYSASCASPSVRNLRIRLTQSPSTTPTTPDSAERTPESQVPIHEKRIIQRGRKSLFAPTQHKLKKAIFRWTAGRVLLVCFAALCVAALGWQLLGTANSAKHAADTLVIYIYSETDPEYIHNLEYFVRDAVQEGDRCEYVFVVQQMKEIHKRKRENASISDEEAVLSELPQLPSNARYMLHGNECYDWGTFGWVINGGKVDIKKYKYFIFMNSSVRGPFIPPALKGMFHWTTPLLSRLNRDVKLVGPTISCEGSPYLGDEGGLWRRNPHVQSYLVATDQAGLSVLMADGQVFECHNDRWDAIWYSELGSSWAILQAGFNLDSLMIRYQAVDWRNRNNWDCNAKKSPLGEHYYDGTDMDPYEVMFIKYKYYFTDHGLAMSINKAIKYEQWQDAGRQAAVTEKEAAAALAKAPPPPPPKTAAEGAVTEELVESHNRLYIRGNDYLLRPTRYKAARILDMHDRGPECFDVDVYLAGSPDLQELASNVEALWRHWVLNGQFEDRPFLFHCPRSYSKYIVDLQASM